MTIKVDMSQIDTGIPHTRIMIAGLVCTLLFLYCTTLNGIFHTDLFSVFGGLAALCALIWGSDTIKMLNSYGLATGVPSAGMIGFGSGIGAMVFSSGSGTAAPVVALLVAAATGLVLGYLANGVLNMKIPVMIRSLTELSVVGALTLLGLSTMITGHMDTGIMTGGSGSAYISGGLIVLVFMLGAIAVQHPWNAVLPTGKQDRMFMLAAECGFLTLIIAAIISFAFVGRAAAMLSLAVATGGWLYTYYRYIVLSRRDAYAWLDTKPIPEPEAEKE
jgi:tetrahydromethanopterin S-methyltransferase subunit C